MEDPIRTTGKCAGGSPRSGLEQRSHCMCQRQYEVKRCIRMSRGAVGDRQVWCPLAVLGQDPRWPFDVQVQEVRNGVSCFKMKNAAAGEATILHSRSHPPLLRAAVPPSPPPAPTPIPAYLYGKMCGKGFNYIILRIVWWDVLNYIPPVDNLLLECSLSFEVFVRLALEYTCVIVSPPVCIAATNPQTKCVIGWKPL